VRRLRVPVSPPPIGFSVPPLAALKLATSLHDVAELLGYKPSALAYLLYKLPDAAKYTTFTIPKKAGGVRTIDAPIPSLKLLQKRLADLLYACLAEMESGAQRPNRLSHAFRREFSTITNARIHRHHRYVLNLDLSDFFPSLNFGRVRGFFIKNHHFALNPTVATIISQIACKNGSLPQGSPCSPIISELLTHILDLRLVRIAAQCQCSYTRYVDDITFSTVKQTFPPALAMQVGPQWTLSTPLVTRIEGAGFGINPDKIRMQYRTGRQTVTGLVVNEKINVRSEYFRTARAMVHSLLTSGNYHRDGVAPNSVMALEGILNHIFHIRERLQDIRIKNEQNVKKRRQLSDQRSRLKREYPSSIRVLFHRLLFYKHFVDLDMPLIVCEGPTDQIYLKEAIRFLPSFQPALAEVSGKKLVYNVRFFRYTTQARDVLQLSGGSGDIKSLLSGYKHIMKDIKHAPLQHPVIFLIDNDKEQMTYLQLLRRFSGCLSLIRTPPLSITWCGICML
jgi:RNA-directed DNA polymerase